MSKYVSDEELEIRFGFHPATEVTRPMHEAIRKNFYEIAEWVNETLPEGREKSLVFTALQEAAMWANGSVAIGLAPLEPIK